MTVSNQRKHLAENLLPVCALPDTCALTNVLCASTALLSVTALNYLLSVVALVLFYVFYTHSDGCTENKVFISINMLLCIAASLLSILPQIQVHTHLLSSVRLQPCFLRPVQGSGSSRLGNRKEGR